MKKEEELWSKSVNISPRWSGFLFVQFRVRSLSLKVTLVSRQPCTISGDRWLLSLHTHTHILLEKKRKMQWALWKLLLLLRVGCCITSCSRVYYIYLRRLRSRKTTRFYFLILRHFRSSPTNFVSSFLSLLIFLCSFFSLSLSFTIAVKKKCDTGRWGWFCFLFQVVEVPIIKYSNKGDKTFTRGCIWLLLLLLFYETCLVFFILVLLFCAMRIYRVTSRKIRPCLVDILQARQRRRQSAIDR